MDGDRGSDGRPAGRPLSPEAEKKFREYLERRMEQPRLSNGRNVRNPLDRLRMRHATRIWEGSTGGAVVARRTDGFVPYRWTGAEPEGLHDDEVALQIGARWKGDELVTYTLGSLKRQFEHWDDKYQSDND